MSSPSAIRNNPNVHPTVSIVDTKYYIFKHLTSKQKHLIIFELEPSKNTKLNYIIPSSKLNSKLIIIINLGDNSSYLFLFIKTKGVI